jgi:putative FmdB family regulatory protein
LPRYEYRCSRGHQYERLEGFDAPAEQTCPTCGSRSRRQLSLPAVIFKGPGFYSTDNRRGYASGNGGRSSPGSDGQSEDGGSESKAEAAKAD